MRKGQAMVEYALILLLVSIVSLTILSSLGQSIKQIFTKVNNAMNVTNVQNGDCK